MPARRRRRRGSPGRGPRSPASSPCSMSPATTCSCSTSPSSASTRRARPTSSRSSAPLRRSPARAPHRRRRGPRLGHRAARSTRPPPSRPTPSSPACAPVRPPAQPGATAADATSPAVAGLRRRRRSPPAGRRHPRPRHHRPRPRTCADRPPLGRSALSTGDPPCSARPTSGPSSPWPWPSRCSRSSPSPASRCSTRRPRWTRRRPQAELAETSLGPGSLVVHLQNERNRAAIDLIGLGAAAELAVEDNPEARGLTDPAAEAFARRRPGSRRPRAARPSSRRGRPSRTSRTSAPTSTPTTARWTAPTSSSPTRSSSATRPSSRPSSTAPRRSCSTVDDADLRNGAEIVDATTRQSEMRARIVRDVVQATITGRLDDACRPPGGRGAASTAARASTTRSAPTPAAPTPVSPTRPSPRRACRASTGRSRRYLAGDGVEITPLLDARSPPIPTIGYTGLRDQGRPTCSPPRPTACEDEAIARQQLFIGHRARRPASSRSLVTWMASRSITRPLRSLKRQAEEMADTRLPAAVRQILDTPPGEDVVIPEVEPITVKTKDEVSQVAAALSQGAVERRRPRRRAGRAPTQHLRLVHQPRPPQPEPPQPPARLHHRPRAQRDRPRQPRGPLPPRPPRHPHAPQRRVAARAGRHRAAAPVVRPRARLADVVRAALGEVEDYQRCRRAPPRAGRPSPVPSPPTWPTCSPSSSRTACRSRRPTSRSR